MVYSYINHEVIVFIITDVVKESEWSVVKDGIINFKISCVLIAENCVDIQENGGFSSVGQI